MKSKSLLDLMSPEDRQRAIEKGQKRIERNKVKSGSVSPELYIVAELGYYFGWEAVMSVRRGYTVEVDDKGKTYKEVFTLEEALALLEAAKKVWYSKLIETSHGTLAAGMSKMSKKPGQAFNTNMKEFINRAA